MSAELLPILIASVTGVVFGSLTSSINRRRKPTRPPKAPKPYCGCEHHLAHHDPVTGRCNDMMYRGKWRPCSCLQYVGPKPAEEFFTSDVAWGSTVMRAEVPKDDQA